MSWSILGAERGWPGEPFGKASLANTIFRSGRFISMRDGSFWILAQIVSDRKTEGGRSSFRKSANKRGVSVLLQLFSPHTEPGGKEHRRGD